MRDILALLGSFLPFSALLGNDTDKRSFTRHRSIKASLPLYSGFVSLTVS